ncbi:MAG: hypothetical protein IH857_05225 [Deltaproteobacteria bacterium]|nr:hypothetical protein [Deltaproteobacteria bacterium]
MKEKDFQTWWNNHYFATTHPAYRVTKSLNGMGADIIYLVRWCCHFAIMDCSQKKLAKDVKKGINPFKLIVQFDSSIPVWAKEFVNEKVKKLSTDLKQVYWHVYLDFSRRKLEESYERSFKKYGRARYLRSLRKLQKELSRDLSLFEPLTKYISRVKTSSPGKKEDIWGSLFLLVVSEHLRESNGRPNYLLAAKLLKLIRGQPREKDVPERMAATTRVERLKNSKPSWKSDLIHIHSLFGKYSKYDKDLKSFAHDPDYFKEDLPEINSSMSRISPLINLAFIS